MKNIEKSLLDKADEICLTAHAGQFDKGNVPYFNHPLRVSEKCSTIETKIVALLHDIIEDTSITIDYLRCIFPDNIIVAVNSITKIKEEDYFDYIIQVSQVNDLYIKGHKKRHGFLPNWHKMSNFKYHQKITSKPCRYTKLLLLFRKSKNFSIIKISREPCRP